jgi:hypothetical protein
VVVSVRVQYARQQVDQLIAFSKNVMRDRQPTAARKAKTPPPATFEPRALVSSPHREVIARDEAIARDEVIANTRGDADGVMVRNDKRRREGRFTKLSATAKEAVADAEAERSHWRVLDERTR